MLKQADSCALQALLGFMQEAASEKRLRQTLGNWTQRRSQPSVEPEQKAPYLSLLGDGLCVSRYWLGVKLLWFHPTHDVTTGQLDRKPEPGYEVGDHTKPGWSGQVAGSLSFCLLWPLCCEWGRRLYWTLPH